jgi:branched-chain amino acid transport system permease protein
MLSFSQTIAILPQQLVFGLTLGTAYGLIAIGYTMVYGVLFMINFAHGDVFMIGAYVGWALLGILFASHVVPLNPLVILPLLLAAAMVVTGLLGLVLERLAYRPLYQRGATRLGPLISAVGASVFLQNAVMLIAGAREKVYMTYAVFPRAWRFSLGNISVSVLVVVIAVVALAMMLALNWLVQHTWLGRSIRAVAEDREMAAVMGIDVWRVVALTFCIGSALGGAAGVLVGFYYTQVDFYMGYSAGLKAFTAAVLGGIGNVRGAMVGGLILGVVESLAVTLINPAFKDAIAFVVLIVVLMFRPGGILGEALPDWKRV